MMRRVLRLGAVAVSALALLGGWGCETLDRARRPWEPGAAPPDAEDSSAGETRAFFKPSRLSGALSSEARDIERSLGVQ